MGASPLYPYMVVTITRVPYIHAWLYMRDYTDLLVSSSQRSIHCHSTTDQNVTFNCYDRIITLYEVTISNINHNTINGKKIGTLISSLITTGKIKSSNQKYRCMIHIDIDITTIKLFEQL